MSHHSQARLDGFARSREARIANLRAAAERRRVLAPPQKEQVAIEYLAGDSSAVIARRHGWTEYVVKAALRELHVPLRDIYTRGRSRQVNQAFFAEIDDEAKAWCLGFFTADGAISERTRQLRITLSREDRDALESFAAVAQADSPIRDHVNTSGTGKAIEVSSLTINSKRMVDDLARLGVAQNKSLTVRPWNAPPGLMRHYFRGLLDGDGSIYHAADGKWGVSLCGTLSVVTAFSDFVSARIATKAAIHPRGSIFQISYRGLALPRDVAALLYSGATISLRRKQRLADELMATKPHHTHPARFR